MHSYAAFIGHQPHISLAELAAVVPGFKLENVLDKSVVLFHSSQPLDAVFLDHLGGTVTLAERAEGPRELSDIPPLLEKQLLGVKGKATFSLRTRGLTPRDIRNLYRDAKNHLKKKGRASRYVGNEHKPAASVLLRDTGLLDRTGGSEIVVIRGKDLFWTGVTIAAQDIDAYTKRDMEKPVRDTTVGLLPPKLAQILLNFGVWLVGNSELGSRTSEKKEASSDLRAAKSSSRSPKSESRSPLSLVVFDPFCGTGVIPMEALLRGYAVLASDKSEKAVTGCQKNLEWIRKERKIKKTDVPSTVWKQDATKPFAPASPPDVVVTETSLGPNLRSRPTSKEAASLKSESEKLQEQFLKNAAASLPGVPLVCTWPVWYYSKGPVGLERIWNVIDKLGYEAVLPPHIVTTTGRTSLLYRRPEQFVGREIVLLKAKKK